MASTRPRKAALKRIFSVLDEDNYKMALALIEQYCFMEKVLDEAKKEVEAKGITIDTFSGNGFPITVINPAKQVYDNTYRHYSATWTKLVEMLPKSMKKTDVFLNFVDGNRKGN